MIKKDTLIQHAWKADKALGHALEVVEAVVKKTSRPPAAIVKGLKEIRRLMVESRKPRRHPMKCICGRRFRSFQTWFPHWEARHPVLHKRYSSAKGKKGRFERTNLMLKMMRAASA